MSCLSPSWLQLIGIHTELGAVGDIYSIYIYKFSVLKGNFPLWCAYIHMKEIKAIIVYCPNIWISAGFSLVTNGLYISVQSSNRHGFHAQIIIPDIYAANFEI